MRNAFIDLRIAGLDVEQIQVDVHQLFVSQASSHAARGVETGMHAELFTAAKKPGGELGLDHRLTTGKRNAAFTELQHLDILLHLTHRLSEAERVTVPLVPGVRVVAVLATQQTAREKNDQTQTRSINSAAELS